MSNGIRIGNGRLRSDLINEHDHFLQEHLMEAQQSLFFAKSVKEARFLQNRIEFLKRQLKTNKSNNGKRKG